MHEGGSFRGTKMSGYERQSKSCEAIVSAGINRHSKQSVNRHITTQLQVWMQGII